MAKHTYQRRIQTTNSAALFFILTCVILRGMVVHMQVKHAPSNNAASPVGLATSIHKPIPTLQRRNELGDMLEHDGLKVGLEIGVQCGLYSEIILSKWPSCEKYFLVDVWRQQKNYDDGANVDDGEQERRYQEARDRLRPWADKTEFYRMYSSDAIGLFDNEQLDFIYVDARHDFCGVKEDIEMYWPKLRPNGIMAGHDYVTATEVMQIYPDQDWSLCEDGSHNNGSVKGAVDEFASAHGLQVSVTYQEPFPTWIIRKPAI